MEFPETCWTVLAQATLRGGPAGRAALEQICPARTVSAPHEINEELAHLREVLRAAA